ncbi:iron ABC transporter permease [Erysipelotrichaceae bacterium HCN-30851]
MNKHPKLFLISIAGLLVIGFFIAINIGSIQVSPIELFKGLFIEYNADVASIYQIRFPRVIVSIFIGGALALSGMLLQVVFQNPLADPGIIGISQGASFMSLIITFCFPSLYFVKPLFAFLGGIITFAIIYSLSWKTSPTRLLLVGVAMNYIIAAMISFMTSSFSSLTSTVTGSMTFMTWQEANQVLTYVFPFMILTLFVSKACELLSFNERTLLSLGVPVSLYRGMLALLAVILCSLSVAIAGVMSFVGLIVPHITRLFIKGNYRYQLLSNMLLGGLVLLIGDTLGRVLLAPYEISASVMMALIGGPLFILLLKRGMCHD